MANPFSGIITQAFKDTHKNMIDALLDDNACTVPCRIRYGGTKWADCTNCIYDAIGGKSANRYQTGGPVSFPNGQICPVCNGSGKTGSTVDETIYLAPIWDSREWIDMGGGATFDRASNTARTASTWVQTLGKIVLYPKLKRAKTIFIDTDIENYGMQEFTRQGDPEPCGLGAGNFVVTMWSKVS